MIGINFELKSKNQSRTYRSMWNELCDLYGASPKRRKYMPWLSGG